MPIFTFFETDLFYCSLHQIQFKLFSFVCLLVAKVSHDSWYNEISALRRMALWYTGWFVIFYRLRDCGFKYFPEIHGDFYYFFICFSRPTSPPRGSIGLVLCVPLYTLSSPAFKGVTCGMDFKHKTPVPDTLVHAGATMRLEHVNKGCLNHIISSVRGGHITYHFTIDFTSLFTLFTIKNVYLNLKWKHAIFSFYRLFSW